jgi:hypothetical protein
MSRKARIEKRLLAEQDTVGQRRTERKEQEELAGKKKLEASLTKAQRLARLDARKADGKGPPPRIARAGKPLRR